MAFEPQMGVPLEIVIEPFVMQHTFLNMDDNLYKHVGPAEQHGDFSWRIFMFPVNENYVYGVECLKNHGEISIETWTEAVLSSANKTVSMTRRHMFDRNSFTEATNWDEVKTLLKNDGGIKIGIRVETKKVYWVKPIERNFTINQRGPYGKNWVTKRFFIEFQMRTDDPIDGCSNDQLFPMKDLTSASVQDVLEVFAGSLKLDDKILVPIILTAKKMKLTDVIKKCEQFLKTGSKRSKPVRLQMAKQFNFAALETHLNRFEEAELCFIETNALNCPVCIEVFDGEPESFPCGHTVCYFCSEKLKEKRKSSEDCLLCPVCRKSAKSTEKNYALINVLESLDMISANRKKLEKAHFSTLSTSNNQLRKDCAKKTKRIAALKNEINDMECVLGIKKNQKYVPIDKLRQTVEHHNATVKDLAEINELLHHNMCGLREELAKSKQEIELMAEAKKAQEKVHQETMYAKHICLCVTLSVLFCLVMYFWYSKM